MSRIEEDRRRQRDRYLLLIVAAVGAVYLLWGVSRLFAPEREGHGPPPLPAGELAQLEADLALAERLLDAGRTSEASKYLSRVHNALQNMRPEGLRPARALHLSRIRERAGELSRRIDAEDETTSPVKGNDLAAPGGIQ